MIALGPGKTGTKGGRIRENSFRNLVLPSDMHFTSNFARKVVVNKGRIVKKNSYPKLNVPHNVRNRPSPKVTRTGEDSEGKKIARMYVRAGTSGKDSKAPVSLKSNRRRFNEPRSSRESRECTYER